MARPETISNNISKNESSPWDELTKLEQYGAPAPKTAETHAPDGVFPMGNTPERGEGNNEALVSPDGEMLVSPDAISEVLSTQLEEVASAEHPEKRPIVSQIKEKLSKNKANIIALLISFSLLATAGIVAHRENTRDKANANIGERYEQTSEASTHETNREDIDQLRGQNGPDVHLNEAERQELYESVFNNPDNRNSGNGSYVLDGITPLGDTQERASRTDQLRGQNGPDVHLNEAERQELYESVFNNPDNRNPGTGPNLPDGIVPMGETDKH